MFGLSFTSFTSTLLFVTVTVHVVTLPFALVTVIVTVPSFKAFTTPFSSTLAIAGLLLFHVSFDEDKILGLIIATSFKVLPFFTLTLL